MKKYFLLLVFFAGTLCTNNIFADHYETNDPPFVSDIDNTRNILYKAGYFAKTGTTDKIYSKQYGFSFEPDTTVIYLLIYLVYWRNIWYRIISFITSCYSHPRFYSSGG